MVSHADQINDKVPNVRGEVPSVTLTSTARLWKAESLLAEGARLEVYRDSPGVHAPEMTVNSGWTPDKVRVSPSANAISQGTGLWIKP